MSDQGLSDDIWLINVTLLIRNPEISRRLKQLRSNHPLWTDPTVHVSLHSPFKIRTKLAIYWFLPLFLRILFKSVVCGSLLYPLKTWTDLAVHSLWTIGPCIPLKKLRPNWRIPTLSFLKFGPIRWSVDPYVILYKIWTDSAVRGSLHLL